MEDKNKIFIQIDSAIEEINADGTPFCGNTLDPDKDAQYSLLCSNARALADSAFVDKVTVESAANTNRNVHVYVDMPSTVTFNEKNKPALPACMNAADHYMLSVVNGNIRLTLTIFDLWKE